MEVVSLIHSFVNFEKHSLAQLLLSRILLVTARSLKMHFGRSTVALAAGLIASATAQTYSDCNPMEKSMFSIGTLAALQLTVCRLLFCGRSPLLLILLCRLHQGRRR